MDLIHFQNFLDTNFAGCFLIPAKLGGKAPLYKHKNGAYDSNKFRSNGFGQCENGALIILASNLIVIDIDSHSTSEIIEKGIPEFSQTVCVSTKKGYHYYFKRTSACDSNNIYDSSRKLSGSYGVLDIDIKTCRKPGKTPGTISIPPSPDKSWLRSYTTHSVLELPEKFVEFYQTFIDQPEFPPVSYRSTANIDTNLITIVLEMLSPDRADDWAKWMDVGWTLYNSGDYLDLWISWSQTSDKFIPGECEKLWNSWTPHERPLTFASLRFWAKSDNPEKYREHFGEKLDDVKESVIKNYVKNTFKYSVTKISNIVLKNYESKPYIFINIDEKFCKLVCEDHDSDSIYISIGQEHAKEKCRQCEKCIIEKNSGDYPSEIKNLIIEISKLDPCLTLSKFLRDSDDEKIKQMNSHECKFLNSNPFYTMFDLPDNLISPHHDRPLNNPENYVIISPNRHMGICSRSLGPGEIYPPDGILLPKDIYNNIVNINTTNITNHYYSNMEEYDDFWDSSYDIFEDPTLNKLMNMSFKGYASDISRVFMYLSDDIFGIQFEEKDIWWSWDDLEQRWIKASHKAHIFCDEVVAPKYLDAIVWFKANLTSDQLKNRMTKLDGIIKRLKDRDQNSILSQAAILLKDKHRDFENKLDSNKDIINFRGDIYDFETLQFRKVKPINMVSKSTGYAIPASDLEIQASLMKFIRDLMPDDLQTEYLLTWIASCLDGHNREETFHILTGSGRNGKSLLRDLIANTFGESNGYFLSISSSMLTGERPSSEKPVPDLLALKGARMAIGSEPEKKKTINGGFLKFLTGNDPIMGRWLNSNSNITFKPQHSLALLCNNIPKLSAEDEAIWDRNNVIEFPYKFVLHPKHKNHKPIDRNLKNKISTMGPQFMLILLQYYERYKRCGLEPTPEIMEMTQGVRDDNDIYSEFVDEFLIQDSSDKERLKQSEINSCCTIWFKRHNIYHKNEFNSMDLKSSIERVHGIMIKSLKFKENKVTRGWKHIKFSDIALEMISSKID